MARTQEITGIFYTHKIAKSSFHLVDYFIDMVRSIGAKKGKVEFKLNPSPQAAAEMQKILSDNLVDKDNFAVFVPGATVEDKRWPFENFAALAEKLYGKYRTAIVAVGVESERGIIDDIQKISAVPILNLAGRTDIHQLVAVLAAAKVVVGNDTGPSHIAAAMGVPMVLVFGRTNPLRVGPYGRRQTVAAIDAFKRAGSIESTNPAHHIRNVTVETVFELISEQLG
jgi:ADP-heptose:LPS heptosyltransferase